MNNIFTEEELIERELAKKPKKEKKPKAPKAPKQEKTEAQLVHEYANAVIGKSATRGQTSDKFEGMKKEGTINKDLWLDTDFFFSVVFQSADQKYKFLEGIRRIFKFEVEQMDESQVQIINGLKLANVMGIPLALETRKPYPCGDLELKEFVLDYEEV